MLELEVHPPISQISKASDGVNRLPVLRGLDDFASAIRKQFKSEAMRKKSPPAWAMEEKMNESNWDKCLRMAREMDKKELIKNLLMQIAKMRKPRERSIPLWSFVGDATNHGSGVSSGICAVYGVDSDTGKEAATARCESAAQEVANALSKSGQGMGEGDITP